MKQFAFTLMLFVVVLSPLAAVCQDAAQQTGASAQNAGPAQPTLSPAQWERIQRLPWGKLIQVTSTDEPPLECSFAGADDATLFCSDPDHLADRGFQIERSRVLRVNMVKPHREHASLLRHVRWGKVITPVVVGTVVLVTFARDGFKGSVATGAGMGAVAALVTGAVEVGREP